MLMILAGSWITGDTGLRCSCSVLANNSNCSLFLSTHPLADMVLVWRCPRPHWSRYNPGLPRPAPSPVISAHNSCRPMSPPAWENRISPPHDCLSRAHTGDNELMRTLIMSGMTQEDILCLPQLLMMRTSCPDARPRLA